LFLPEVTPNGMASLLGLAALLLLSAFFSGSETALFSLSRFQVQRLGESGGGTGRAVARLLSRPRRLLITILVGNMFVNVASATLVATVATRLLGDSGVGAAIGVTTLLLLIFGEVTPKTFAVRHAEGVARAAALPLLGFSWLIMPLRWVLRHVTSGILVLLRHGHVPSVPLLTQSEFDAAFAVGEEEGVIDEHEREMVEHILELRETCAREVMTPRTEMVCVAETATIAEALETARNVRHSRLPVHTGDIDEVWGILDLRDLPAWCARDVWGSTIRELVESGDPMADTPRRPLVHPVSLVPETVRVGDLLRDMRESGAHMAILVDEYGGTAGVVTLHQLVNELVGGVLARGRGGEPLYRCTAERLQVLGEARVRDVNSDLGLGLPVGRADSVGGYVLSLFGDLPRPDETVSDGRYVFRVLRLGRRRIDAVELTPGPSHQGPWPPALEEDTAC
jgi:CBS domain containing-hemolysin-like protein